ncbi:hypothetical protein Tco_0894178 [Tanacetum coccineum]|uniref:Uncharacterized protein n=1 Tax=Tanacetum coccineum TaxID=301880 RepID=A0ABQ5CEA3_9ASTR
MRVYLPRGLVTVFILPYLCVSLASPTHSNEFLGLKKVKSWLENSKSVDSLVSSDDELEDKIKEVEEEEDDLEYFDIFPTMKELGYHEWLFQILDPLGLESIRKPKNPRKIFNFMGRVRGLKVFIGNFTYECDFMVLEDTTGVIDHYLDFKDIKTDCIPPFVIEGDDDNHEKTHYSDSLNLRPEYKYDESVSEAIRGLMKNNKGGVT